MPEALKPCPFCSGEAMQVELRAAGLHWWQVECIERKCSAIGPTAHATEAEAITAWNTRTTDPEIARLQDLVAKFQRGGVSTLFAERQVNG